MLLLLYKFHAYAIFMQLTDYPFHYSLYIT